MLILCKMNNTKTQAAGNHDNWDVSEYIFLYKNFVYVTRSVSIYHLSICHLSTYLLFYSFWIIPLHTWLSLASRVGGLWLSFLTYISSHNSEHSYWPTLWLIPDYSIICMNMLEQPKHTCGMEHPMWNFSVLVQEGQSNYSLHFFLRGPFIFL